jgi:2-oxoglutarate ferredoxin oxidoreductase subunit beta
MNTVSANDLWIHDERDLAKATLLVRFFDDPKEENHLPRPFGVFYEEDRACYEDQLNAQMQQALNEKGVGDLDVLLKGRNTWTIA